MFKKISIFAVLCLCTGWIILSKITPLSTGSSIVELITNYAFESANISDDIPTDIPATIDSNLYYKYINVPATEKMPALSFEIIGKSKAHDYYTSFYYPHKLTVKMDETIIQEIIFNEDDFAPCTLDTFGFEYGDFKFDGYGGFRILSTSMGKNPSYYFWIWDKNSFVEYPELEMVGYMTFDYNKQQINVSSTGGGNRHEFIIYKYIEDKLTLIEKVIDADSDGFRKVYKLINGELELIETSESQLKG